MLQANHKIIEQNQGKFVSGRDKHTTRLTNN